MVQFNLLPDVKIEYIKTKYRKRLILLISAVLSAVTFAIFIVLFLYVRVSQPHTIKDADEKIKASLTKIQGTEDLDKILTVQNQLNTLPQLQEKKVVLSRLTDYLTTVVPNDVTISSMSIDLELGQIVMEGNAPDLATVNKFTDTLKFTGYIINDQAGIQKAADDAKNNVKNPYAFKSVVLNNFTVPKQANPGAPVERSSYGLSFQFDPTIFKQVKDVPDGMKDVELKVPNITSSRSETEKPLFVQDPNKLGEKKD